jgi:hypothetical protein
LTISNCLDQRSGGSSLPVRRRGHATDKSPRALALWKFLGLATVGGRDSPTTGETVHVPAGPRIHGANPPLLSRLPTPSQDMGTGLFRLIEEGKLTGLAIGQAVDIYVNWKDVDLRLNSPSKSGNALNMELRERGWDLLWLCSSPGHGGLTLTDYILLIGLQHTLLDTTHAERFSPFYTPAIFRWVASCSAFLDVIDHEADAASADLLIWVCLKLAGSLTATFLRARSTSQTDPRFKLMAKMMRKYPKTREWWYLEQTMQKFQWRGYCMEFWRMCWEMVVHSNVSLEDTTMSSKT